MFEFVGVFFKLLCESRFLNNCFIFFKNKTKVPEYLKLLYIWETKWDILIFKTIHFNWNIKNQFPRETRELEKKKRSGW